MSEIKKLLGFQSSGLTDEEIENADSEMEYFFVNIPLHEAGANLWEIYKVGHIWKLNLRKGRND